MNLPYGPFARLVCARAGCGLPVRAKPHAIYCSRRCAVIVSHRLRSARDRAGIVPVPRAKPMRQWREGDRAGAWVLVRRGDMGSWFARCTGCGVVRTVNASAVAANGSPCQPCVGNARRLPRLCRSCGTTDPTRFKKATECATCNRAACRNGRCGCGRAVRRQRDCPCGRRADIVASRILRAIDGLHGAGVAPTRGLLLGIVGPSYAEPLRDLVARGVLAPVPRDVFPPVRKPVVNRRERRARVRDRARAAVEALHAIGVAPTRRLLREIVDPARRLNLSRVYAALGIDRDGPRPKRAPRPRKGSDYVPAPTIKRSRPYRPRRPAPAVD